MPGVDELLEELRALRRGVTTMFAAQDESDEEAAKRYEADAKRHNDEAARHREAAKKAREADDEEDATAHDASASTAHASASAARQEARKHYEAAAKKLRGDDGGDEDAAKRHEAEAKRLADEDAAAQTVHATAEAEAKRHSEDAAARKEKSGMMTPRMAAMFLKGMGYTGKGGKDDEDAMGRLLAMTFAPGSIYDAQHDDVKEDTALFKRLLRQYKEGDGLEASTGVVNIRVERRLRSLEAAMGEVKGLLTDVVDGVRGLATDGAQGARGLATDQHRGANGGPVRKTMSATGTDNFVGKFDNQQQHGDRKTVTLAELNAAMDERGVTDIVQRMAMQLEYREKGLLVE